VTSAGVVLPEGMAREGGDKFAIRRGVSDRGGFKCGPLERSLRFFNRAARHLAARDGSGARDATPPCRCQCSARWSAIPRPVAPGQREDPKGLISWGEAHESEPELMTTGCNPPGARKSSRMC